ncbi:hypothetical protein GQY15_22435 [Rhodobacter sphaeroides]|uniref:hypothetical protein n=1 Tax=Cereibacter sphaeroides TaxID=1063 RepID=UPI001325DB3C|nr:hypothetical protein [Cereibacter sphaeroides]
MPADRAAYRRPLREVPEQPGFPAGIAWSEPPAARGAPAFPIIMTGPGRLRPGRHPRDARTTGAARCRKRD